MKTDTLQSKILLILNDGYIGRQRTIKCPDLIKVLHVLYDIQCDAVDIRIAVNALRKAGNLVGSASGSSPKGYYMIETLDEYKNFINEELGSRLADLSRTITAMDRAANIEFGNAVQMSLLEGVM